MSTITTTELLDDLDRYLTMHSDEARHARRFQPQPERVKALRQKATLLFSRYASWPKPLYIMADNTGSFEICWDSKEFESGLFYDDEKGVFDWDYWDKNDNAEQGYTIDATDAKQVAAFHEHLKLRYGGAQ